MQINFFLETINLVEGLEMTQIGGGVGGGGGSCSLHHYDAMCKKRDQYHAKNAVALLVQDPFLKNEN